MSTLTGLLGGGGAPTRITSYTSGSGSFTPLSTSTSWLRVTLVGGGAGGAGSFHTSPGVGESYSSGWGGGGGAAATYWIKAISPSYSYVVGAGGTGGGGYITGPSFPSPIAPLNYTGSAGGNTTFGSFFVSGGGSQSDAPGNVSFISGGRFSFTGQVKNAPSPNAYTQSDASWQSGSGGIQTIAGGWAAYTNSPTGGGGNPAVSPYAGDGGFAPGWGGVPNSAFYKQINPAGYYIGYGGQYSNGGTVTPSLPSPFTAQFAGGGGGGSILSTGGVGGSIQSPFSAPAISATVAPGYGGGGAGGALMYTPNGFNGTSTAGSGSAGSGGIIIIEEFSF